MSVAKIFLTLSTALLAAAVAAGAFGAHALRARLAPELLAVYQTAVQYHFYHALGLALIGVLAMHWPDSGMVRAAGWSMVLGVILFSGSLYLLSLTGMRMLGAITPLGGVAFIAAWMLLGLAVWRNG